MKNVERAAELIYSHMSSWDDETQAVNATQALADAGLLIPNLPESKWSGFWEVDGLEINGVDKDGEVLIEYESGSEYIYGMQTRSLWLNRDQVIAILAAANYAEQEQDNA